jgi:WD40 repeat protein
VAAAFTRDGSLIATGSSDDTARLWDARTGQPLCPPLRHKRTVARVAFSADDTRLVTASWDGTACLGNARTGELLTRPLTHDDRVVDAAFCSDGGRVVTASWDGVARVWDTRTGLPLTGPLRHPGRVVSARLSNDGTRVLTACADGLARVWSVPRLDAPPPEWLPQLAEAAAGQRLTPQGATELLRWEEVEAMRVAVRDNPENHSAARVARWWFKVAAHPDDEFPPSSPSSAETTR